MEHTTLYNDTDRKVLLKTAHNSIDFGLGHQKPMPIAVDKFNEILIEKRGCFVTLHLDGHLRGCIGSLQPKLPLIVDCANNAFLAAFKDPRFGQMTYEEFKNIQLDISVLSESHPMSFNSEENLLKQLRPGIDGLILSDNGNRGTFLPSVWEQLPDPKDFLGHLKQKAGLPTSHWSDTIKIERYTTELIS